MAPTRAATRIALRALALSLAIALGAYLFAVATGAQPAPDTTAAAGGASSRGDVTVTVR